MMDYAMAEGQRMFIDEALSGRKRRHSEVSIPECGDGSPCFDGRCPMCGSDLDALVSQFFATEAASRYRWCREAFVINEQCQEIGDGSAFDFDLARRLLSDMIEKVGSAANGNVIFLASYGLLMKDAQKYAAIEYLCTAPSNQLTSARGAAALLLGATTAPLMEGTNFVPDGEFGGGFVFNLLPGYNEHDGFRGLEYIDDEALLGEMALNYGAHQISTRLVTNGFKLKRGQIVIAPGEVRPLLITSFDGLSE
ncbi:hypothetical protein N2601_17050 [Rhizobium sp. CB3060]|uniref:hypothetical protein n=1 Tax=Rhizobium sp. CB3060 TaxID=3138255 RepID=UPI0021A4F051|nr:hypothetical protein [Rhizobium tropici]UWU20948.1 hypothetical protein N2601_17050 [Rhizobium tropici]